jgi:hypothetical protein
MNGFRSGIATKTACAELAETVEEAMTIELEQEVRTLEAACHHLLLRPDDTALRQSVARTIATMKLATAPDDNAFVRGLVAEIRAHADSLAFRLEGAGYDGLHIGARTALLCQALANLKEQLPAVPPPDGETIDGVRGDFHSSS